MSFVFWQWTGGVEQRCDCYRSVSHVSCSAIAGPPQPSINYCQHPSSTTSTTVSTSSSTTTSQSPSSSKSTTPTTDTTTTSSHSNETRREIILITGGNDGSTWNSGAHAEVETLGGPCHELIPDLSYPRRAHLTLTTADQPVLTCGGDADYSCLALTRDSDYWTWSPHSQLDSIRWYSASVTLPSGVFILGGYNTETTSSFLATGRDHWTPGPEIPQGGSDSGCAVKISDTKFLLIGGEPNYEHVMEYDVDTRAWTQWPRLSSPPGGRRRHQCAVLGDDVIIVGGQDQYHEDPPEDLASTAILHIPSKSFRHGGAMSTRRSSLGLGIINGKLLAFGGYNRYLGYYYLDSIEEWNSTTETWSLREEKLEFGKDFFGFTNSYCL